MVGGLASPQILGMQSELKEVRRSGSHLALGWFFFISWPHLDMEQAASAGVVLMVLLAAFLYASVVIVEVPDGDAAPAVIRSVVDGDTVELSDGRRVRLVGYDAYELSEPLGQMARQKLSDLCPGKAYLDVDDLEPQDRYGRVLGYLWCQRTDGNVTWYVSVQKFFIVGDGRKYVKRLLYIPPDEHPYTLWTARHVVKFDRAVEIYVYNDTKSPHRIYGDAVVLTSGVYEVYYGGRLAARLRLMSHTPNATVVYLPTADATAINTPATASAEAQQVLREAAAANVAAVKKPHVHSIIYVAVATAVAVALAVYMAKRSRSVARR
jgi:hypothetical protein